MAAQSDQTKTRSVARARPQRLRWRGRWQLAVVGDEWLLRHRRVLGPVVRMRLPFMCVLSVTQALVLRTLRTKGDKLTPEDKERFIYLILCTVSGVAAGLQNTG